MSRTRSSSRRRHYLEAPLRRRGLVIAPTLILALAAAALALVLPAHYRAAAVIRVEWRAGDGALRAGDPDLAERRSRWVRQQLDAPALLASTLAEARPYPGDGGSTASAAHVERLRSDLRVRPLAASSFAVEYVHRDPAKASQVLNVLLNRLAGGKSGASLPDTTIAGFETLAPAATPATAETQSPVWFGAAGAVLGLLLGLSAALVAEHRDASVKGPEDLAEILPVPLLAILPELRERERDE